ncbi:MAG: succinate dehydrogenase assembly factor 2 [Dongiaceae bacterium]
MMGAAGDVDTQRRRLRFRSAHRGNKELDLILERFATRYLDGFTASQLDCYERILEFPDPDLYNWLAGLAPVPEENRSDVLDLLLKFDPSNAIL